MEEPQERNPFSMAPAAQPKPEVEPNYDNAREIRPVVFGHQNRFDKDFRPVESQLEEAPKGSLAPASATTQSSVIGLEDLSVADPETNAPQTTVEKDTKAPASEDGSLTSSKVDSIGKSEPPVVT